MGSGCVLALSSPSCSPEIGPGAAAGGQAEFGDVSRLRRGEDAPGRTQLPARLQGGVRGKGSRYKKKKRKRRSSGVSAVSSQGSLVCVRVSPSPLLEKPQDCATPSTSPSPSVKISSILPECHMWCTLMRCIFNPADLHLQKFPLPVQQRNGSQMQCVCGWLTVHVCVCVPCLSICFSFSYLKLFWFGKRGDCSQMLIHGGLQTAISLISFSKATWGAVWTKAEQSKHVRFLSACDSFRKEGSLFIVPPVEGRIQGRPGSPAAAHASTAQWSSEIVYQNKKWLNERWPCSPLSRRLW